MTKFPKNKYKLDLFRIGVVNIPHEGDDEKFLRGPFLCMVNMHDWSDVNVYTKLKIDNLDGSPKESGIINYFEIERLRDFLNQTIHMIDDMYDNPEKYSQFIIIEEK